MGIINKLHKLGCIFIIQLLIISIGLPQDHAVSPCERAKYDAEHDLIRTQEMLQLIFETSQEIEDYSNCYSQIKVEKELQSEPDFVKELISIKPITISRRPWKVVYLASADQIMRAAKRKRTKITFTDGSSVKAAVLKIDTTNLFWQDRHYKSKSDTIVTPLAEIKEISVRRSRLGGGARYLLYGGIAGGTIGFLFGFLSGPGDGVEGYSETAFDSGLVGAGFIGFVSAIFSPPIGILFPGNNVYLHEGMAWEDTIPFEQILKRNAIE